MFWRHCSRYHGLLEQKCWREWAVAVERTYVSALEEETEREIHGRSRQIMSFCWTAAPNHKRETSVELDGRPRVSRYGTTVRYNQR